jgi:hypothetical protein
VTTVRYILWPLYGTYSDHCAVQIATTGVQWNYEHVWWFWTDMSGWYQDVTRCTQIFPHDSPPLLLCKEWPLHTHAVPQNASNDAQRPQQVDMMMQLHTTETDYQWRTGRIRTTKRHKMRNYGKLASLTYFQQRPHYLLAELSCSRQGVVAARLTWERPDSVTPVSKTFALLAVHS